MAGRSSNRGALQSMIRAGRRAWQGAVLSAERRRRGNVKYVQGIYKGNFVRRKIEVRRDKPVVPKLPPAGPTVMPKQLTKLPPPTPSQQERSKKAASQDFVSRAYAWLKQNGPVLVLNFGSICTLAGFTRQDVLELRGLATSGSLSFVIYSFFQHPIRWAPIAWSSLFASVNAFNIYRILYERKAKVELTEHEQDIFVEHFMPHGVTPKQFERIMAKAKPVAIHSGEYVIRQGEPLKAVDLVVSGSTRANIMGRHLTMASSSPGNRERKPGVDSGAWVGEMAFLESFWQKEQAKVQSSRRAKTNDHEGGAAVAGTEGKGSKSEKQPKLQPRKLETAIYSVVAVEDCEVLRWTHEDIEGLMHISTDMRAAMTRAMTAAVVGKVINFTLSSASDTPTWSTWLDDWKNAGAGARVNVKRRVGIRKAGGAEDKGA